MHQHKDRYEVSMMCELFEVSRSGYYAWSKRRQNPEPPAPRQQRREQLVQQIQAVHQQSNQTYGSPRVYQELKAQGQQVCENTVAKLMREHDIRSVVKKRFKLRTTDSKHAHPIAPNRLDRCFDHWPLPNQAWAADITYVRTGEGWLYLAAVIDLCSRKIVGWAMADHLRAELCVDALWMALKQRRPACGEGDLMLMHHSDRGVQYACGDYQQLLDEHGIVCSMSGKGDCYDNAVIESFFKTLKAECVYQQNYATRQEAMSSIFRFIECWYNKKRRHSSLGYLSPEAYETSLN
jgi:transposase InsO family protein